MTTGTSHMGLQPQVLGLFNEWIRALNEEVIQGEYRCPEGNFIIVADRWRSAFDEGLSPSEAFARALDDAVADATARREIRRQKSIDALSATERARVEYAFQNIPTEQIKQFWDAYDGSNTPGGFANDDIRTILNLRGEGEYWCQRPLL